MNSYTDRELQTRTRQVLETTTGNTISVITENGKPAKILLDVHFCELQELERVLQQIRAMRALTDMNDRYG